MTAGAVMAYLLQSALFLSIGHLLYKALLSRMKMPAFNRAMILTIYIFSLVAPSFHSMNPSWPSATSLEDPPLITDDSYIVSLNTSSATMPQTIYTAATYPDDVASEAQTYSQVAATHSSSSSTFPWQALCVTACIGAAIGLLHLLLSLAIIVWIGLRSESRNLGHVRLLLLDNERISPFSLLNMIFMPRSDWNNGSDMIIAHEMGHIRHLHSIDLLISRGCLILMWWNPSAWLLNRELRAIHEYQADDQVLRNGHEIRDYQLLLIRKAAGTRLQSVASSLNHSKLKQRFTMMYQKNPSSRVKVRAIALVPAFCGVMLLTGQNSIASFIDELSQTSLSRETIDSTTDDGTIRDDKVNQTIAVAQTQQFAYAHENHEPIESETVAESADADEPTETAVGENEQTAQPADEIIIINDNDADETPIPSDEDKAANTPEQRPDVLEQAYQTYLREMETQIQEMETRAQAIEATAQSLEQYAQILQGNNQGQKAATVRRQAMEARKDAAKIRKHAASERRKLPRWNRKNLHNLKHQGVFTEEQKKAMEKMTRDLSDMNESFAGMDVSFSKMNKSLNDMSESLAKMDNGLSGMGETLGNVDFSQLNDIPHTDAPLTGKFVRLDNTDGTNVQIMLTSSQPVEIGSATMQVNGKRHKCSISHIVKIHQQQNGRYASFVKVHAKKLTKFSNKDYVTIITDHGTVKVHLKTT